MRGQSAPIVANFGCAGEGFTIHTWVRVFLRTVDAVDTTHRAQA